LEVVESLFYKKINPGDLLNIDFAVQEHGGGQTYLDLAGIDQDSLCSFLKYGIIVDRDNPPSGDNRLKFRIVAKAIGTSIEQSIEFDPRNNRPNYKLSDQRGNRHPAWTARFGFPHAPEGARFAKDVTNAPNLLIYIICTSEHKYYAGFVNEPVMPISWPHSCGFEDLFSGKRRGVLHLDKAIIQFVNDRDCPFKVITAETDIQITDVPSNLPLLTADAVEFTNEKLVGTFNPTNVKYFCFSLPHSGKMEKQTARKGHRPNYIVAQQNRTIIGEAGEKAVIELEKRRLHSIGRDDLAERVEWVSKTRGDGLGYDVLSFELNGRKELIERYIEVKTTTGGIEKPFEISDNEVQLSKEFPQNYVLVRIFGFRLTCEVVKYYEIQGSVADNFKLVASSYTAHV